LQNAGSRDKVKLIIGGASVIGQFANKLNPNCFAPDTGVVVIFTQQSKV